MKILDTICAPATTAGSGAIALIRISGPDALAVADKVIEFRNGTAASAGGNTLKYGTVPDVDEVIAGIYRAPHSYTGEDAVEISCHSSRFIVGKILQLLIAAGARMAEPGEFTRRAFAAGKMDLSQAEAVADIIAAESGSSHKVALNQLRGKYSSELKEIRKKLTDLASLLELELDFSEEDVEFANRTQLRLLLESAASEIKGLIESFKLGNAIKNGIPVAIVGAVNAGKSTLLNALLGEDRAIVSDIPGTTRDTIEETLNIDGMLFRFIDTAGIRESSDAVEKIGIQRSYSSMEKADIVIGVLDGNAPLEELLKAAPMILSRIRPGQKLILVRSKVDTYDAINPEEFPTTDRSYRVFPLKYPAFGTYDLSPEKLVGKLTWHMRKKGVAVPETLSVLDISAKTGEGMDELKRLLAGYCADTAGNTDAVMVTSLRHYEALVRAQEDLDQVALGLDRKTPIDLVAQDLRSAIYELGSIFGEVTSEDILQNIFAKFCIGK